MKWVLLFIFMLSFSLVGAHTSFELADVYSPEHTLVIAVPDTVIGELDAKQVFLYRDGHVNVPWEYGVSVRGDKRYIWGVTPRTVGNYSIVIQDALVVKAGAPLVEDVSFPFIIRGNSSEYSFTPGVIDLNASSLITVTSRADVKLVVAVESAGGIEVTLSPGKNTINLTKLGIGFAEHFVLGEYDVPVVRGKAGEASGVAPHFTVSPGDLTFRGAVGSTTRWNVTIQNERADDQRITFSYNKTLLSVSLASLSLDAEESETLFISLASPLRASFTTAVILTSGNYSYPLTLTVILTTSLNESNRDRNYSALLCPEIPGFICRGEQTCGGQTVAVSGLQTGEVCCAVACVVPEEPTSWTPGLLFLAACAVAGGAYYYYKVKKNPDAFEENLKRADKKVHP